nr:dTDP-4-dehydrorhamnose 3,5-epimerase family protein [Neoroseomonas lacus]
MAWNDPALGIDWPVDAMTAVLSDKDRAAARLAQIPPPFPRRSW